MPEQPETTPRKRWPRTKVGRRALRAALAGLAGTALGTLCHFVPDEARELCQSLASLARLAVGLW